MQLTFIVAVNMMGSGIIMLPTNMAQVGAISLLSWIVTALGSMAIAYGFAQAGHLQPARRRPGGLCRGRLRQGGLLPGVLPVLPVAGDRQRRDRRFRRSAILPAFFPWLSSTPIATCIGVIALLWLTTVANFGGPSITGQIGSVTVWGVILPVGLLSIIGWFWFSGETFSAAWNPHGLEHRAKAWARASRSRSGPSSAWSRRRRTPDAVENPKRDVPLACMFGTLGRGRDLHPVDHRDPGHRAECRAGEIDRAVRARLRPDVQPDGRARSSWRSRSWPASARCSAGSSPSRRPRRRRRRSACSRRFFAQGERDGRADHRA